MEEKKISVIVPVYNAQPWLERCIESVLQQEYPCFELILINDGSKDCSEKICLCYESADSRVIYYKQSNAGVSTARNKGLELATGTYVVFLDSDDFLNAGALELLIKNMEISSADLCICGYDVLLSDHRECCKVDEAMVSGENNIAAYFAAHYLEAIASSVWGKLYKRSLIMHQFNTLQTMGEDMLFNLDYIRNCRCIRTIDERLYVYNKQNENSLTNMYKISYYKQDTYVAAQWLSWFSCVGDIDSTNVYERIANSFFNASLVICAGKNDTCCVEQIKDMIDANLAIAIRDTLDRYNIFRRTTLRICLYGYYHTYVKAVRIYERLLVLSQKLKKNKCFTKCVRNVRAYEEGKKHD